MATRQEQESVHGYKCTLVEPVSDIQPNCSLCHCIIREPYKVDCCGTSFCELCISHIKHEMKPCPSCERINFLIFPDLNLRSKLNFLQVYCSHQHQGCEWTGRLGEFDQHLNEFGVKCGFMEVLCPHNCGARVLRKHLDIHVLNECPLTMVKCDFHHVGCKVELCRNEMAEHVQNNTMSHSLRVVTHCANQQTRIQQHETEIDKLKEENKRLQCRCDNLHTNFSALETNFTRLQTLKCSLLSVPVLFLENFSEVKSKISWHSDAVYTHYQGYKICLVVYPDGFGSGTGSHVSVFVCFMKGEFDDLLEWPFRGFISFQLLDQLENKEHLSLSVAYKEGMDDRVCNRVTNSEVAELGRGSSKFILISDLEPKYLHNNKLLFRVHDVIFHVKTNVY